MGGRWSLGNPLEPLWNVQMCVFQRSATDPSVQALKQFAFYNRCELHSFDTHIVHFGCLRIGLPSHGFDVLTFEGELFTSPLYGVVGR